MSILTPPVRTDRIVYPDSDGEPMAENTLQFRWITTIVGGLRAIFLKDPSVFVAGDLFWYPVEGRPNVRLAPDAMVAFGRPKGERGSYQQWEEAGVAPQVVFEILSPSNRFGEMSAKFNFYQRYGVEEYYIYDPDPFDLELSGFVRKGDELAAIEKMDGHVSPRLGIKFEMVNEELIIVGPDGKPFRSPEEVIGERDQIAVERDQVVVERDQIAIERDTAVRDRDRTGVERDRLKDQVAELRDELERLRKNVPPKGD